MLQKAVRRFTVALIFIAETANSEFGK